MVDPMIDGGNIRFEGGLCHNQHIWIKPWRLEWHFIVPCKPVSFGCLEHYVYYLYRLVTASKTVYYEYHLERHYRQIMTAEEREQYNEDSDLLDCEE